ncbi:hypothetical protein [Clavibacter zhangzhiyongii]|uniref:hypothetical protein n=1 Tax=Clavibacter zhangzhiyongii TaxID=2768071 RepID=UPI001F1EFCE6|nr:hypothetical protein [Clavibacter zhangzhiyongii]
MSLDVDMRRGPAVIRVAEGATGTRLRVHSLRVTGQAAARETATDARRTSTRPGPPLQPTTFLGSPRPRG